MKYEIALQDETVVVKITEEGITENLTMLEPPTHDSMLVISSKKDVLGEIDLEKMLGNLDHCVDLLQITFNAVDGFSVQGKVQILSNKFIDAMNMSNVTALDFKLATGNVLDTYMNAYGNLFYGETDTAIMLLADTKSVASKMVKKSDELVKIYDGLTSYTNNVLIEVMNERASDEDKRAETAKLIHEFEGSAAAMNALQENLKADIAHFEADYASLQKREIEQEKRAADMQIASLIMGGVGAIFSPISNLLSNNEVSKYDKKDRDEAEKQASSECGETSAEIQSRRDYNANIKNQEGMLAANKKADERIEAIDIVLDGELYSDGAHNATADKANLDTQKTGDELRTEKQEIVTNKGKSNEKLNELKGQEKALAGVLKGLGVAMDKVSEEVRTTAKDIQKNTGALTDRLAAIGKKRDELKDQERANLVKLAENTAKMQNMVMDENSLESAVQCLVIAINCLRRVLAYLQEIKLFWMNVETFCDNLASNDSMQKMISMQGNKEAEKRAAYFKTMLFVKNYIGVVAKWQALHVIFTDYLVALAKVSKRMSATLEQSLSADRKTQWQLASKLAGDLKNQLDFEIDKSQKNR